MQMHAYLFACLCACMLTSICICLWQSIGSPRRGGRGEGIAVELLQTRIYRSHFWNSSWSLSKGLSGVFWGKKLTVKTLVIQCITRPAPLKGSLYGSSYLVFDKASPGVADQFSWLQACPVQVAEYIPQDQAVISLKIADSLTLSQPGSIIYASDQTLVPVKRAGIP